MTVFYSHLDNDLSNALQTNACSVSFPSEGALRVLPPRHRVHRGCNGSLVVFVWRGAWVFLDAVLFPTMPRYSAMGSMVLGMTVTLLVFAAQLVLIPYLRHVRKGVGKIVVEDAYHTICFVGDINMWRACGCSSTFTSFQTCPLSAIS
ncbi:hypothetical protein C7M84_014038 [Penaeus vannamei]|uniref:Uncharacterized protein n=1 Tax=Penaeus vannamei TaxID=6689 RepID=A0A423SUI3_PENVA|nr:hypothetical protein C7M84_014038 [Penaeus vannamei]